MVVQRAYTGQNLVQEMAFKLNKTLYHVDPNTYLVEDMLAILTQWAAVIRNLWLIRVAPHP